MRMTSLLPAILSIASAAALAQSPSAPIESAAWLAGCWSADGRENGSGEHWMQPAGGSMLGVSRTIKDGKMVAFEFMQIRATPAGSLIFVALPSGQRETSFTLSSGSESQLVFENLQNDFPHRISYQAQAQGKLLARIEGIRAGVQRAIDFPMTRVPCEKL